MPFSLEQIQFAARKIEADGEEAFHTVCSLFGHDLALTLLVAHLRHRFGAGRTFPSDPAIDGQVEAALKSCGLID